MKIQFKLILLLLAFAILMSSGSFAKDAVVKNEVIVDKKTSDYLEIRHIVLKGTNEEIGYALGDIAWNWLDVKLPLYASPVYAKARREYMKKNYPILLDRMQGVANSYGLPPKDDTHVTSSLFYDLSPIFCSTIYFPPNLTTNGHTIVSHNVEFYTATMREFIKMKPVEGEHKLFSRDFVMEMYPDKGYPSIVIGTMDLLNGMQGGMNSKGLFVAMLADNNSAKATDSSVTGDASGGLTIMQLERLLLDTCANVEEAKIAILNTKLATGFEPSHLMVCDTSGKSFIYELSGKDFTDHFTDNERKTQIMTNHSVYLYPDVSTFPEVPADKTYNSFFRFKRLDDYVKSHKGKFSVDDAKEAMTLSYGHSQDKDEGAAVPLPMRTLWTMVYDLDEGTIDVKFYAKDGPSDAQGDPTLVFTKPFKFKLEK